MLKLAELRDCRTRRSISLRIRGCNKKLSFDFEAVICVHRDSTLRDGNDLAGKTVDADNHRLTHQVNLADRFAAKGHAPDLAFAFDHLSGPDAFRFEVNALAGDLEGALAADLLPRSLLALRGRNVCLSAGNGGDRRQISADQNCHRQIEYTLSVIHIFPAYRRQGKRSGEVIADLPLDKQQALPVMASSNCLMERWEKLIRLGELLDENLSVVLHTFYGLSQGLASRHND